MLCPGTQIFSHPRPILAYEDLAWLFVGAYEDLAWVFVGGKSLPKPRNSKATR